MDETLTGLDQESTVLAEKALLKYLDKTMLLVVDHHTSDNNYRLDGSEEGFYQEEIYFDGTIYKRPIPSQEVPKVLDHSTPAQSTSSCYCTLARHWPSQHSYFTPNIPSMALICPHDDEYSP